MNITIIGASAGIGLETVKRGLNRNHSITTLSRSEIEIKEKKSLNMILGDATNKADLINSIQQADAIIVTLGTGRDMKATTLFSDFAKLIVEINREKKMDVPFIFVTGFGAGESKNYVPWIVKLFLKYLLKDVYADKTKMEEIITNSDLNWTVVRPANIFGEYDNFDGTGTVIATQCKKISESTNEIEAWGDGSPIRDFVYAGDVANGLIKIYQDEVNDVVNLGSGIEITIKEIVNKNKYFIYYITK